MKRFLVLTTLLTFLTGQAQNAKSGIGTADPQQTLHVAGAPVSPVLQVGTSGVFLQKPTVRVEGLNSNNNTAHNASDGTNSLKRVYANQTGDLVLVNGNLEQQVIIQDILGGTPAVDPVPEKEIVSLVGLNGYERTELRSVTFTLKHPSVVYFSASFAALIRQTNVLLQPVTINDNAAKIYGAYFQFSVAPAGVSTTATFGKNRKTYTNNVGTGVQGDFALNPRAKLVLPVGTYTVKLYGELYEPLAGLLLRAQFGGSTTTVNATTGENFLINSTPLQYQ